MRMLCWAAAVVSLLGLPAPARTCSVPVFRYALDRWPADPYAVTIIHHEALTAEQEMLVARLRNRGSANLQVRVVTKGVKGPGDGQARLIANYPHSAADAEPAWTAPLDGASVARLLDSPLRQEIARRILAGQSAVWVLLESGDRKQDDDAARLLEQELARMPKTLQLPAPDDALAQEALADTRRPRIRIEFSLLRLSPKNLAEEALVSMLVNSESDLKTYAAPMAFAVFGRGRALEALVGKGIRGDNIESSCRFIIGACSCEVKRANPGRDLLMAVDWEREIGRTLAPLATGKKTRTADRKTPAPEASAENAAPTTEELAPLETPSTAQPIILPYVLAAVVLGSIVVMVRRVFFRADI